MHSARAHPGHLVLAARMLRCLDVITDMLAPMCASGFLPQHQSGSDWLRQQWGFASNWLRHDARSDLEAQVCTFASAKRSHQGALWPFCEKQIMPMVAPVTLPKDLGHPVEWRLDGAVTTIGELLLRVGGPQDSFAGLNCMKLHVQLDVRLVVRITKRHRNNWWGTEHTCPCCTPGLSN